MIPLGFDSTDDAVGTEDDLSERADTVQAVVLLLLAGAAAHRAEAERIEREARELALALDEMRATIEKRGATLQ